MTFWFMFLVGLFLSIFNIVSLQWGQEWFEEGVSRKKGTCLHNYSLPQFPSDMAIQAIQERGEWQCEEFVWVGMVEEGGEARRTPSFLYYFILVGFFFSFKLWKIITNYSGKLQICQIRLWSLHESSLASQIPQTLPESWFVQIPPLAI